MLIDRRQRRLPGPEMCRCLRVSPSGFYDWRERPPSTREIDNQRLLTRIRAMHVESDGVLGAGRIWEDLRYAGETLFFNEGIGKHVCPLLNLNGQDLCIFTKDRISRF